MKVSFITRKNLKQHSVPQTKTTKNIMNSLTTITSQLIPITTIETNCNITNCTSSEEEEPAPVIGPINIAIICISAIVITIEITLNSILIIIYFFKIKKRTFSNSLYISNCFVDFLNGCIVLPMNIASRYCYKDLGHFMCYMWMICDWWVNYCSL